VRTARYSIFDSEIAALGDNSLFFEGVAPVSGYATVVSTQDNVVVTFLQCKPAV
jgi:hypothetical protein